MVDQAEVHAVLEVGPWNLVGGYLKVVLVGTDTHVEGFVVEERVGVELLLAPFAILKYGPESE